MIARAAILLLLGGLIPSCAYTSIYEDGQLVARIGGNLGYHRTPGGTVTVTLNHSDVIRSQGNASTKALTAIGTAATAIVLAP